MHARYYNLNLGRFLSVDPVGGSVGSSQSWNRYSYVLNNPVKLVDPYGMEERIFECAVGEQCTGALPDIDEELRAASAQAEAILAHAIEVANSPNTADEINAKVASKMAAKHKLKLGQAFSLGLTAEGGASGSGSGSLFVNFVNSPSEGSSLSITLSDSLGEQVGTPVAGLSAEFQYIGMGVNSVADLAANRYRSIGADLPFVGGEAIFDQAGKFRGFNFGLEIASGGAAAAYARESKDTFTFFSIP